MVNLALIIEFICLGFGVSRGEPVLIGIALVGILLCALVKSASILARR